MFGSKAYGECEVAGDRGLNLEVCIRGSVKSAILLVSERKHEVATAIRSSMIVHKWRVGRFTPAPRQEYWKGSRVEGVKFATEAWPSEEAIAGFRPRSAARGRESSPLLVGERQVGSVFSVGSACMQPPLRWKLLATFSPLSLSLSLLLSPDRGIPSRDVRINRFAASL